MCYFAFDCVNELSSTHSERAQRCSYSILEFDGGIEWERRDIGTMDTMHDFSRRLLEISRLLIILFHYSRFCVYWVPPISVNNNWLDNYRISPDYSIERRGCYILAVNLSKIKIHLSQPFVWHATVKRTSFSELINHLWFFFLIFTATFCA